MRAMELNEWIKAARTKAELTQAQLGEYLGVSKANVSGWENGRHTPSYSQLLNISTVTGAKLPHIVEPTEPQAAHAGTMLKLRRVPVVGTAKMGDEGYYEEIGSIVGAGDGHIEIAVDDPNAYGIRIKGQSMFPAIRDGWYVLVEPNGTAREGEYVLLKLADGRRMVKEFLFRRGTTVEVMSVNGGERLSFDIEGLDGMQPVGAVVSPSKWRPD